MKFFVLFFLVGCAEVPPPETLSVLRLQSSTGSCSAALVSANAIVTAKHCMGDKPYVIYRDKKIAVTDGWEVGFDGIVAFIATPIDDIVLPDVWALAEREPYKLERAWYLSIWGSINECLVTRRDFMGTVVMQCAYAAVGGESGSAVVGNDGLIWGVVSMGSGKTTWVSPITELTDDDDYRKFW